LALLSLTLCQQGGEADGAAKNDSPHER
jgi:hypothetical protein